MMRFLLPLRFKRDDDEHSQQRTDQKCGDTSCTGKHGGRPKLSHVNCLCVAGRPRMLIAVIGERSILQVGGKGHLFERRRLI